MAPSWVVHVVHIAVPCGDGAIYLYCRQDGNVKKPVVHRAVLIDGGRPMGEGSEALRLTIMRINLDYDFAENCFFEDPYQETTGTPSRSLRFDAIVVTHWDEDHHLGVLGLIAAGYEKSFEKFQIKKTLQAFCGDKAKPCHSDKATKSSGAVFLPCWYCKYDYASLKAKIKPDSEPAFMTFDNKKPLSDVYKIIEENGSNGFDKLKTTLYVPCSVSTAFVGPFRHGMGDSHRFLRKLGELKEYKSTTDLASFLYLYDKRVKDKGKKADKTSNETSGNKNLPDPFPRDNWTNHLVFPWFAKVQDKYVDYLGADLLTGKRLPKDSWKGIKTPDDLAAKQGLSESDPMGFYIIAGYQYILGETQLLTFQQLILEEKATERLPLPPLPADPPKPQPSSMNANGTASVFAKGHRFTVNDGTQSAFGHDGAIPNGTLAGSNKHSSTPRERIVPELHTEDVDTVVEEGHKYLGKAQDLDTSPRDDAVSKNAVSITTVIMGWKQGDAPKNYEILHFAGGDVDWDVEGGLVKWLAGKNRTSDKSWMCRPRVWKLNHHGSKKESSLEMMNILLPDYYVCSSSADGDYGHPNPETILILWAQYQYFQALYKATDKKLVEKPFLCTAYPKWLAGMDDLHALTLPKVTTFRTDVNEGPKTRQTAELFRTAVTTRTVKCGDATDKDPFEGVLRKMKENLTKWKATKSRPVKPDKIKSQDAFDNLWSVREVMIPRWNDIVPEECTKDQFEDPKSYWITLEVGQRARVSFTTWPAGPKTNLKSAKEICEEDPPGDPATTKVITVKGLRNGKSVSIADERDNQPLVTKKVKKEGNPRNQYDLERVKMEVELSKTGKVAEDMDIEDPDSDDDPEAKTDPIDTLQERTKVNFETFTIKDYDVKLDDDDQNSGGHGGYGYGPLPVLPKPKLSLSLPRHKTADEPPAPYLLVSNVFRGSTFRYEKERFAMLENETVFDDFASRLANGFLVVSRAKNKNKTVPGPGPAVPSTETLRLLPRADRWGRSLVPGGLGIEFVDLTCSIRQQTADNPELFTALVSSMAIRVQQVSEYSRWINFKSTAMSTNTGTAGGSVSLEGQLANRNATVFLPVDTDEPQGQPCFARGNFSVYNIFNMFAPSWFKMGIDWEKQGPKSLKLLTGSRSLSGLYVTADSRASACMRLDFDATDATAELIAWINKHELLPIKYGRITKLTLSVFRTGTGAWINERCLTSRKTVFQVAGSISIGPSQTMIDFRIRLKPDESVLTIKIPGGLDAATVFTWFGPSFSFDDVDRSKLGKDPISDLAPTRDRGQVDLTVHKFELVVGQGARWNCTVAMQLNVLGSSFIASLSYPSFSIRAEVWREYVTDTTPVPYLPWLDEWSVYMPTRPEDIGEGSIDLKRLDPDIPSAPDDSFLTLSEARFQAASQPGGVYLDLFARIDLATPRFDFPMLWPAFFIVHGVLDKTLSNPKWQITLDSVLYLPQQAGLGERPRARLQLTATVSSSGWSFAGAATDLDFMSLYSYFDKDARETVLDMLSGICIPQITLQYDHASTGSLLAIDGVLQIKMFALDFTYRYTSSPKGLLGSPGDSKQQTWLFTAGLRAADAGSSQTGSLLDILEAFIPTDSSDQTLLELTDLPFIKDLSVTPAASQSRIDPITFSMHSSDKAVIMWLRVELVTSVASVSVLFLQYKYKSGKAPGGSAGVPRSKTANVKRYIRVRFDRLPTLHKVPVLGEIPPPVDSLDYVYVKDNVIPEGANSARMAGLYADEISEMNETLDPSIAISYKEQTSAVQARSRNNFRSKGHTDSSSGPGVNDRPALRAGHHFIVMSDGVIILDHLFGNSPKPTTTAPAHEKTRAGATTAASLVEAESGSTFGTQKKSVGGLSITSVGIKVKDSYVYILMDGSLRLGPIEVDALGLGIGLPLTKITKPQNIDPEDFSLMLSGLGVMYDQPPILIAGGFKMDSQPGYELYTGGLLVTIPPYAVTAAGAYRKALGADAFKSVFIYGRLDGPLLTLEFAEISGVSVSFGYNYALRSPDVSNVQNFPLLSRQGSSTGTSRNPLDVMVSSGPSAFTSWLQADKDVFYFSVGLKADALQVLTVEAALVFGQAGGSGGSFKASMIGRATAQMPPAGSRSSMTFLYAELGFVATLDIEGGSFVTEAQLSSNSFVLAPSCRIQGGFALAYWFGPSTFAGDWVFTVGGYHPAFSAPQHWPKPPRVGIAWQISDELRVGGEGFYAITPKAAMGGAHLFATFNTGIIYADFEAWASFLLNYRPLFFVAEIGFSITVGARFTILFIHVDIHGSVYADLFLQGPPFGGYVDVDFKLLHFRIYFGQANPKPRPLSFVEFLDAVAKPGLTGDGVGDNNLVTQGGAAAASMIVATLSAGALAEKQSSYDQEKGSLWFVRAGAFRFRVECKFPIRKATIDDGVSVLELDDAQRLNKQDVYARLTQNPLPMESSTLKVRISGGSLTKGTMQWRPLPFDKSLPQGMWAQYSSATDPTAWGSGNNQMDWILSDTDMKNTTISHIVGYNFVPPEPTKPDKNVTIPAFNAVEAMSEGVFQEAHSSMNSMAKVKNPLIPRTSNDEKRPRLPSAAPADTSPMPGAKRLVPDVAHDKRTIWHDVDDAKTGGLADWVSAAYGWQDAPRVITRSRAMDDPKSMWEGYETVDVLSGPSLLRGAKPGLLLEDIDRYYMSYPFIAPL